MNLYTQALAILRTAQPETLHNVTLRYRAHKGLNLTLAQFQGSDIVHVSDRHFNRGTLALDGSLTPVSNRFDGRQAATDIQAWYAELKEEEIRVKPQATAAYELTYP